MKLKICCGSRSGLLGIIIVLGTLIPTVHGEYRSWTPIQGQKYQAQLIWATPTNALLQAGAKQFWVNLSALTEADKTYVVQETPRVVYEWRLKQKAAAEKEVADAQAALEYTQGVVNAFRSTPRATSANGILPSGKKIVVNTWNCDTLIADAQKKCERAAQLKASVEAELEQAKTVIAEKQKTEEEARAKTRAVEEKARAEEQARIDAKVVAEKSKEEDRQRAEEKVRGEEKARAEAKAVEERAKTEEIAAKEKALAETKKVKEKAEREATVRKTPGKPIGPKIKGLCIGMNIYQARDILRERLVGFKLFGEGPTFLEIEYSELVNGFCFGVNPGSILFVKSGKDGLVDFVGIDAILANWMFKADDLEAKVFVEKFIDAYGIPAMELSDDLTSWCYTSPDGVKIKITTDKRITIERTASEKDLKKAFD